MVNRLQYLWGDVPEPTSYPDYYEIEAIGDTYIVPFSTALAVERQLERCVTTDWLEFRDVFGARHRMPARHVYRITESTRATRGALREFRKAMREQEREDGDER